MPVATDQPPSEDYSGPQGRVSRRLRLPPATLMWLVWAAAIGWATTLYYQSPDFSTISGMGEVSESHAAAPEVARVAEVRITVGQRVNAGAVMISFDTMPLDLEAAQVQAELAQAEAELLAGGLALRRDRYSESRSFEKSIDVSDMGLIAAKVDAGLDRAEAEGLRLRIRWWDALVKKQLAAEDTLQDLRGQLAAAEARILARNDAVAAWQQRLARVEKRFLQWQKALPALEEDPQQRDLGPLKAAIAVTRAKLQRIQARKQALTVRAMVDGVVSRVLMQPGDVATAGQTVVVLRAPQVRRVIAYAQDTIARRLRVGAPVQVLRRDGTGKKLPGHVVGFGGVAELPLQLQSVPPRAPLAAEEIIIELDHAALLPGEPVDVAILPGMLLAPPDPPAVPASSTRLSVGLGPAVAPAAAATTSQLQELHPDTVSAAGPPPQLPTPQVPPASATATTAPQPLVIPASLSALTRFEPSGWIWIPERQRYLLVSDDTGHDHSNDHAPWVFGVSATGEVDAQPWVLKQCPEISDLESVTRSSDGAIWLLASQSVSRKGNRNNPRTWLMRAELRGDNLVVTAHRSLASALALMQPQHLEKLGVGRRDPHYRKGAQGFDKNLDLEGIAADGLDLLLALKRPLDGTGQALIWRLKDAKRFMATGRLQPDEIEVWARIALSAGPTAAPMAAGVADLLRLPDGRWAILATALGDGDEGNTAVGLHSALFLAEASPNHGRLSGTLHQRFAGVHAEGIALSADGKQLAVVFDESDLPPRWLQLPLPQSLAP